MVITKIQPISHHVKFKTGKQESFDSRRHSSCGYWSDTLWTISGNSGCKPNMSSATPSYAQMPKITGSLSVEQTATNFMKENLKVSFLQASEIAAKQFTNGTVVGGHLGVVQGYLVYTFFVLNLQNKTGYLTIIDAGNGKVLYTSQGVSRDSFGRSSAFGSIGTFGPWIGRGFGGGFWRGSVGAWGFHGFGNGLGSN